MCDDGFQKQLTGMRRVEDGHIGPVFHPRSIEDRMSVGLRQCIRRHSKYSFGDLIYLRHLKVLSNSWTYF